MGGCVGASGSANLCGGPEIGRRSGSVGRSANARADLTLDAYPGGLRVDGSMGVHLEHDGNKGGGNACEEWSEFSPS